MRVQKGTLLSFQKGSVSTLYEICLRVLDFGQREPIGTVLVNTSANFPRPSSFPGHKFLVTVYT